jgi:ankyrin repeat protein
VLYSVQDAQWKLADFGISAEATSKLATTTKARGTYEYMAPELQWRRPQFSNKSDIWALGCILHELATGDTCFESGGITGFKGFGAVDRSDLSILLSNHPPKFLEGHVTGLLEELLANDSAHRPSAKVVHRSLNSYCQLFELPWPGSDDMWDLWVGGEIENAFDDAQYPSYSEWKELQLPEAEYPGPNGVISLPLTLMIENSAGSTSVRLCDLILMHDAADSGDLDMLKRCKDAGADMSALDEFGWTPMHYAARNDCVDVLELLYEMGGDISARKDDGRTPMHEAAENGNVDAIKVLHELGGDISARDDSGKTPMHVAAVYGYVDAIKVLHEMGGDISANNYGGGRPMHEAALYGNVDAIKVLHEMGVDISVTDRSGSTPMHCAALNGNVDAIKLLHGSGGDISATNNWGRTPMELAMSRGRLDVVEAIKKIQRDI